MIEVTLDWFEVTRAAQVGLQRQVHAMAAGKPDVFGYEGDGWNIHIEGALGELAFAKATNRYWSGPVNTFKEGGDVGSIQVRTRSRDDYDLIVRPNDRDQDVFVLVLGKCPTYKVVGWLVGSSAKKERFLQKHGGRAPAYFVPKEHLNGMNTLQAWHP